MNNFELIDDYLANRLKGAEKENFERQLSQDPALKSETDLQTQIVKGIRQSRAAELKAMLNNVPVTGGAQVEFSVMRIAAGVVLAGLVSAAVYYYMNSEDFPPIENAAANVNKQDEVKPQQPGTEQTTQQPASPDGKVTTPAKEEKKTNDEDSAAEVKPAAKPSLDIADPSSELAEENEHSIDHPALNDKADIVPAHVQVEMDSSHKKYNFHYQFADSKLMLYGSFDRSLYEVLEVNNKDHALFLFYKDNFYLLDESEEKITKLSPIQDKALLTKLREYRSR